MKDTNFELERTVETDAFAARYEQAIHSIMLERKRKEMQGYAMMTVATAMAGGYEEKYKPGKAVVFARNFCILFAFLVPSLLLIRVVL